MSWQAWLPWIVMGAFLAVSLWCTRKRRNRYISAGAWPRPGNHAHHSFWNNDRRGHAECR